jgi:hypothetical protein
MVLYSSSVSQFWEMCGLNVAVVLSGYFYVNLTIVIEFIVQSSGCNTVLEW